MMSANGNGNGLATAEDFRKASPFGEPERILLPKLGKEVLVRRPDLTYFIYRSILPTSLAAKVPTNGKDKSRGENIIEYARLTYQVLRDVMVEPRVSLEPGPDEISPDMMDVEDCAYIVEWAKGAITGKEATGSESLETFREERSLAGGGENR